MTEQQPFKWRHFEAEIILLSVRWYLRYALSYRDLEEMMRERGLQVDHTTIYRWAQHYAPELEKRCRPHLKATNAFWRVDETYVKVKGVWMYLYRAVDSEGNTLEFQSARHSRCSGCQTLFRESSWCLPYSDSTRDYGGQKRGLSQSPQGVANSRGSSSGL